MNFKYNVEDIPPKMEMLLYGIQWFAITLPIILVIGNVIGNIFPSTNTVSYIQSLFIMIGIALLLQIKFGHKLPTILGPATVLLIAVLGTMDQGIASINSSVIIGGAFLAIIAFSGALKYFAKLFTTKVIIVILLLIAFTLTPTILDLIITNNGVSSSLNFIFLLVSLFIIFICHKHLKGLWNAIISLFIIIIGTIAYYLIFTPSFSGNFNLSAIALPAIKLQLTIPDIGTVLAFLICFLALSINDIGSIQATSSITKIDNKEKRIKKGVGITGIMNIFSGIIGVIGPVNYSMTPGVIAATKSASRYPLYVTAAILIVLAFSPILIAIISAVPSPVIAVVLIYIMTAQIGASLMMAKENNSFKNMDDGIIVGLPILMATLIAFLPETLLAELPLLLRPILGNSFVMGVMIVLLLEHLIFKSKN
ncbi:uracil-xanthine permease family protein [Methanobrevibacter sp. DSM 116169]|uniref:uracil-xanthine permease family protein n=1 Tax=Methanobrevibacter sp. DSM 116169 TaxID=3242727 RepID=UPI0038FBFE81